MVSTCKALIQHLTWLVKKSINILIQIIMNMSFDRGNFPASQKQAVVHPQLMKPTMNPNNPKSYRSVSNLSFVSKVIDRFAANRFNAQTGLFNLLPAQQSAHWYFQSTKSAQRHRSSYRL